MINITADAFIVDTSSSFSGSTVLHCVMPDMGLGKDTIFVLKIDSMLRRVRLTAGSAEATRLSPVAAVWAVFRATVDGDLSAF